MAPIGILTAVALILFQTLSAQYLKVRTNKDQKLAEEPSRVSFVNSSLAKILLFLLLKIL